MLHVCLSYSAVIRTLNIAQPRDNVGARTLSGASFVSGTDMTIEACINFCDEKSFIYAGTEFSVRSTVH